MDNSNFSFECVEKHFVILANLFGTIDLVDKSKIDDLLKQIIKFKSPSVVLFASALEDIKENSADMLREFHRELVKKKKLIYWCEVDGDLKDYFLEKEIVSESFFWDDLYKVLQLLYEKRRLKEI